MDTIEEDHEHDLDKTPVPPDPTASDNQILKQISIESDEELRRPKDSYLLAVSNLENLFTEYRNHIEDKLERYGDNLESNFVMLENFVHELLDQNALLIRTLGEVPQNSHGGQMSVANRKLDALNKWEFSLGQKENEQYFLEYIKRLSDNFQEKVNPSSQSTVEELERQTEQLKIQVAELTSVRADLEEENENLRHDLNNLVKMNKQKLSTSSHLARSSAPSGDSSIHVMPGQEELYEEEEGDDEMFIFTEVNPEDIYGPIESIRDSVEDLDDKENKSSLMVDNIESPNCINKHVIEVNDNTEDTSFHESKVFRVQNEVTQVPCQAVKNSQTDEDENQDKDHSSYASCESIPPSVFAEPVTNISTDRSQVVTSKDYHNTVLESQNTSTTLEANACQKTPRLSQCSSSSTSIDISALHHLISERDLIIEQLQTHLDSTCQEIDDKDHIIYELECKLDEKRHQCEKLGRSVEAMDEFRDQIQSLSEQKRELTSQLGQLSDLYANTRQQLSRTEYQLADALKEVQSQNQAIKFLREALLKSTSEGNGRDISQDQTPLPNHHISQV